MATRAETIHKLAALAAHPETPEAEAIAAARALAKLVHAAPELVREGANATPFDAAEFFRGVTVADISDVLKVGAIFMGIVAGASVTADSVHSIHRRRAPATSAASSSSKPTPDEQRRRRRVRRA